MNYVLTHHSSLITFHCLFLWALFLAQLPWSASASDQTGEIDPQAKIIEIKFYIDGTLLEESPRLERLRQLCEISAGGPLSAYALAEVLKTFTPQANFHKLKLSDRRFSAGLS